MIYKRSKKLSTQQLQRIKQRFREYKRAREKQWSQRQQPQQDKQQYKYHQAHLKNLLLRQQIIIQSKKTKGRHRSRHRQRTARSRIAATSNSHHNSAARKNCLKPLKEKQLSLLEILQNSCKQTSGNWRRTKTTTAKAAAASASLSSSTAVVLLLFLILCKMPLPSSADWLMDCGDCHCKWNSGKKTADCKNLSLSTVPENLSNEIQVLDLSLNRIVYMEENIFLNADLTNLHKLYIRNSSLQQIDPRTFTQLEILIELDVSFNLLRSLQVNQFARLVKVRAIVLNGNLLESLQDGIFQNLKYLHKIELKDNRLKRISSEVFQNVPLLSQIYLNNNRLNFLRKESFESVKRLTALSMDGNPWNCTCELQIFRDFVLKRNLYTPPTACYYPSKLRGMLWIEDQPEAFACKPKIIFPAKGASITTSKENVTLICRVHASANTHIAWDYNKQMFNSKSQQQQQQQAGRVHIQLIEDEQTKEREFGRNLYISRLTILGADKSDEGTYTCIAENAGGKDSVQMSLLVQKPGSRDLIQGNLAAVISLMALGLLSVSIFLAMVTCCIYKRFINSTSLHQHRHHHLDLSGGNDASLGTVVANHATTTVTDNTSVMLGVVNGDTDSIGKYKKHHQQTAMNGGSSIIKDKYAELIKSAGGGGGGGVSIADTGGIHSGNSPLMELDGSAGGGGGHGNADKITSQGGQVNSGVIGCLKSSSIATAAAAAAATTTTTSCDIQLGHLDKKYYEQSNEDMLHIKYPHGRALAEINTVGIIQNASVKARQHCADGKLSNGGITVDFQPDLLPTHENNKNNQQQSDFLYSPKAITPGSITSAKAINSMEDQQHLLQQNAMPMVNTTTLGRNKYNAAAQEYLQAKYGGKSKTLKNSIQEKYNTTTKREAPTIPYQMTNITAGGGGGGLGGISSSLKTSPLTENHTLSRQTKSLFMPQRTVCSATTTATPTDATSSYEYRQPPPPPYNANHRTTSTNSQQLTARRTSFTNQHQYDSNEDNNRNSNTKDQGYREMAVANVGGVGGGGNVGIGMYETARQTIVTASPSMNFPTTITGYNTNTSSISPRRQLL